MEVLEFDFDLGDIILDGIPNIGVVTGAYDTIESILYDIGLVNPITGNPLFNIIDGEDFNRLSSSHMHQSNSNQRTSENSQVDPNVDFTFDELLDNSAQLA